jgi:predicted cupin superfamily sugar epimerase
MVSGAPSLYLDVRGDEKGERDRRHGFEQGAEVGDDISNRMWAMFPLQEWWSASTALSASALVLCTVPSGFGGE